MWKAIKWGDNRFSIIIIPFILHLTPHSQWFIQQNQEFKKFIDSIFEMFVSTIITIFCKIGETNTTIYLV